MLSGNDELGYLFVTRGYVSALSHVLTDAVCAVEWWEVWALMCVRVTCSVQDMLGIQNCIFLNDMYCPQMQYLPDSVAYRGSFHQQENKV